MTSQPAVKVRTQLDPIRHTRPARDSKQSQFWNRQDAARVTGYRRISRWTAALNRHARTLGKVDDLGGAMLELIFRGLIFGGVGAAIGVLVAVLVTGR